MVGKLQEKYTRTQPLQPCAHPQIIVTMAEVSAGATVADPSPSGDSNAPTNGVHEPQAQRPPINEAKLAKNREKKRRKKKKKKAPIKAKLEESKVCNHYFHRSE